MTPMMVSVGPQHKISKNFFDVARIPEINDRALNRSITDLHVELRPVITREEYVTWRAAWRKLYNELSEMIRVIRSIRDNKDGKLGQNHYDMIRGYRQADVEKYRSLARHMMDMRMISKLVAEHSYHKLNKAA